MPSNADYHKKRRLELKRWFREEFLPTQKCSHCSENHPACIDFHHVDPATKDRAIARMLHDVRCKSTLMKELEKCIPLCSNCHRKLHHNAVVAE